MPTVMNSHHSHHGIVTQKTAIQKVAIGMGLAFLGVGLVGIITPGFMNMHLSMAHNLIHVGSGALALWAGYSDSPKKAYTFCLSFGSVYGLLGLAGFLIGQPGYPGVGHMEADQNLLRVIPNVLEFGTADHSVHLLLSAIFLFSAYSWKKKIDDAGRSIVDVQRRKESTGLDVFRSTTTRPEAPNSKTDLSRAELGQSDVNRPSDIDRRTDFESKI